MRLRLDPNFHLQSFAARYNDLLLRFLMRAQHFRISLGTKGLEPALADAPVESNDDP